VTVHEDRVFAELAEADSGETCANALGVAAAHQEHGAESSLRVGHADERLAHLGEEPVEVVDRGELVPGRVADDDADAWGTTPGRSWTRWVKEVTPPGGSAGQEISAWSPA
jgi:hypothetical protein